MLPFTSGTCSQTQGKYNAEHSLTNSQWLYLQHQYLRGGHAEPGYQDRRIQCEEENKVSLTFTAKIYSGQTAMFLKTHLNSNLLPIVRSGSMNLCKRSTCQWDRIKFCKNLHTRRKEKRKKIKFRMVSKLTCQYAMLWSAKSLFDASIKLLEPINIRSIICHQYNLLALQFQRPFYRQLYCCEKQ